jgi:hypothetical protein
VSDHDPAVPSGPASASDALVSATDPHTSALAQFSEDNYLAPVYRERRRFIAGLTAVFGGGLLAAVTLPRLGFYLGHPSALVVAVLVCGAAGLMAAALQSLLFTAFLKTQVRRILHPQTASVPNPPELDAEERVVEMVSYRVDRFVHVWGKTVLTRKALWFLPDSENLGAHREIIRIPLDKVEDIELIRPTRSVTQLFGRQYDLYPGFVRISWEERFLELNVGTLAMAAELIRQLQPRLPGAADVEQWVNGNSWQAEP